MKTIVLMDVDGVMANFEGQLVRELFDKFGKDAITNRSLFSLEKRYKDFPEILEYARKLTANPNFYYPLEECEGAAEFALGLIGYGFDVRFVSSRPASAETFTRRWLRKVLEIEPVITCGIVNKAEFAIPFRVDVDFAVDDNPDQIKELKNAGIKTLCWSQQWNEGVFPRIYQRGDGAFMFWEDESKEATEFYFERQGA